MFSEDSVVKSFPQRHATKYLTLLNPTNLTPPTATHPKIINSEAIILLSYYMDYCLQHPNTEI